MQREISSHPQKREHKICLQGYTLTTYRHKNKVSYIYLKYLSRKTITAKLNCNPIIKFVGVFNSLYNQQQSEDVFFKYLEIIQNKFHENLTTFTLSHTYFTE